MIISERRVVGWSGSSDSDALMHEFADATEDWQGHVLRVGIECEYTITHARVSDEVPVVDLESVLEDIRIDVVEVVAFRDGRIVFAKDCGDVGVFTVVVGDVCYEAALLKKVGGAREIADPGTGLLGPGLVPIEPLTEGSEREARCR
jgi:hypothetical protein